MEPGVGTGLVCVWPLQRPGPHGSCLASTTFLRQPRPAPMTRGRQAWPPLPSLPPAHSWRASEPQGLLRSQASPRAGAGFSQIRFPGFNRREALAGTVVILTVLLSAPPLFLPTPNQPRGKTRIRSPSR